MKKKMLYLLCTGVVLLSACSTEKAPFAAIFTNTDTISPFINKIVEKHIDSNKGFESSTSGNLSQLRNGTVAQLSMSANFLLNAQQATGLYAALLKGVKSHLEDKGCEVSASTRMQEGGGKLNGFAYAYSKGDTKGSIQVWGINREGENFTLLMVISEM